MTDNAGRSELNGPDPRYWHPEQFRVLVTIGDAVAAGGDASNRELCWANVLAGLITGSIVIESVFAWPGIGRMAFEAVSNGDFPLVTGTVLFFTLFYLVLNFITDLLYVIIDPRIKFE